MQSTRPGFGKDPELEQGWNLFRRKLGVGTPGRLFDAFCSMKLHSLPVRGVLSPAGTNRAAVLILATRLKGDKPGT